jgi:putative tricarboxylic transport membrane protein
MKRAEVIASILWMTLGVVISLGALRLGLGAPSDPGSGFLPFWTGALISLLGLLQLGRMVLEKGRDDSQALIRAAVGWKRPTCVVLTLAFYSLLLTHLGYLVTTFFTMLVLFSLYDRRRWGLVSAGSILVTIITYVVFHQLLKVQLPAGLLGFG